MRREELVIYRDFSRGSDKLLIYVENLVMKYEDGIPEKPAAFGPNSMRSMAGDFYECIHELIAQAGNYGFHGNLWHCYLTHLLVTSENGYSRACELRGKVEGTINEAVLHDMEIFREFFDYDFGPLCEKLHVTEFSMVEHYEGSREETGVYNVRICECICRLAEALGRCGSAEEMKDILTEFYGRYGVGRFGLHKCFRIDRGKMGEMCIEPIPRITHVKLDDLVGYEIQKKKLIDNTEAFVAGRRANNCLLFGDAGTGKSSCIKAIANEYYDRGLRVIEVYKHQFQDLNEVITRVKGRNYKFIIFMDDLSFEDFEIEYKYLKAVIEGGLEKRPENILIYATSNRRHLIRENYGDKTEDGHFPEVRQDMHTSDTVQEKLSLAYRFGVTIYFGTPDKKQFQGIVKALAERNGVAMSEEELLLEANKWELSHGGLSGRTAQQFIDYICGTLQD
ncbi:MAG: ATP-binding protein [Lachnospiraceae bacterium]|nr:ATP-binding protein [uncultured Acetatifactor sp.]MCI8287904.1 ATP-binding protein [Lachnospiraceae bacterium]